MKTTLATQPDLFGGAETPVDKQDAAILAALTDPQPDLFNTVRVPAPHPARQDWERTIPGWDSEADKIRRDTDADTTLAPEARARRYRFATRIAALETRDAHAYKSMQNNPDGEERPW